MKRFFRTIGGKLSLFVCCIACLCLLAGSAVLGVFLLEESQFYTASEAEIYTDYLSRPLRGYGYSLLADILHQHAPEADWGNAVWQVQDASGTVICRSRSAGGVQDWGFRFDYGYFPSNEERFELRYLWTSEEREQGMEVYTVSFALKEGLPMLDELALTARLVHVGWSLRYAVFFIAFLALGLSIASFVGLMCVSARRPDTEELRPGALYRVPFDLMLALCVIGFLLLCLLLDEATYSEAATLAAIGLMGLLGANLVLGLSMSAAGRIKGHTLVKNTVIGFCLRKLWQLLRALGGLLGKLPLVWRTALIFVGITLIEGIAILLCRYETDNLAVLWVVEKLFLFPAVLTLALQLRKLQKGGEALAAGDLGYVTETGGMVPALRRHGENLNRIGEGMSAAVEQRLRSERMKTELITNVSHDLKTPLTSIVSYAELIGREEPGSEKIGEYAGVLLRQSERLKRLIEDLVEASKAATGNLEVEPVPCEASVFLTQSLGEYEERLTGAGLTVVTALPERELTLLVDGRRMWRIFDNLLGNIVKYALSGTRAYFSLEQKEDRAVFTFKNTSREALNMPEEELMERFVRGDKSRSTEGSGLGLSIARSMAELQGGTLDVVVDGDLFKAILSFPLLE